MWVEKGGRGRGERSGIQIKKIDQSVIMFTALARSPLRSVRLERLVLVSRVSLSVVGL